MTYVIAEPCIGTKDNSCVEVCPVDCIHPTPDEPDYDERGDAPHRPGRVHRLRRLRRGMPVDACFAEDQLPSEWEKYVQLNADYFANRK